MIKWHSVENILPSQAEDVLMYDGWVITVGWYDLHVFETQSPDQVMYCITHWMPLPEPPWDPKEGIEMTLRKDVGESRK